MKFKIYRDSWLRGGREKSGGLSVLHRASDDKECCMGQMLMQSGATLKELGAHGFPSLCTVSKGRTLDFIHSLQENEANIAATNDDSGYAESKREKRIKTIMSSLGHEVEFVDGAAPWLK